MAGLPALAAGAGPTFVFANACVEHGIETPVVASFLGGVSAAGFRVVAPELPDVRNGVVTPETVDALVRVAEETDGALVLSGASTGGALAILAAADERIVGRVVLVSAIGPFADLTTVLRLATTGHYADEGIFRRHPVEPRLPADTFFPPTEARALERAGHVTPRIGFGMARLVGFLDRMLGVNPELKFQASC